MSQNVNHNVVEPWTGTAGALATAGAGVEGADLKTSDWIDTEGWTDRVISFEVDSGGAIDFDVIMHISSQHEYELNNKTCTTEDYESVNIVTAHGAQILASIDSSDVDELQRPFRSCRSIASHPESA